MSGHTQERGSLKRKIHLISLLDIILKRCKRAATEISVVTCVLCCLQVSPTLGPVLNEIISALPDFISALNTPEWAQSLIFPKFVLRASSMASAFMQWARSPAAREYFFSKCNFTGLFSSTLVLNPFCHGQVHISGARYVVASINEGNIYTSSYFSGWSLDFPISSSYNR
jgi:hypothetical protein